MKIYRSGEGPPVLPQTSVPLPPKASEKPKPPPAPAFSAPAASAQARVVSKVPPVDAPPLAPPSLWQRMLEREVVIDTRVRALGIIPAFTLVLHFMHKAYVENPPRVGELLWMCHVSTLLQMVGLFASSALAIRVASAWSLVGLPSFIIGVATTDPSEWSRLSWLSHVVLPILAIVAMSQVRMDRRPVWFYVGTSFVLYIAFWTAARFLTLPRFNVNLAHRTWQVIPGVRLDYPVFLLIVVGIILTFLTTYFVVMRKVFGPDPGPEPAPPEERTPIAPALLRGLR